MRLRYSIILLIFIFGGFGRTYAQKTDSSKKVRIIFFEKDSNISSISINSDTTEAFFRIVHKGMETKKKRDKLIKKHRRKGLPFPNFYTDFYALSKPKKLNSIEKNNYITVEEYRQGDYSFEPLITIIMKINDQEYLKWDNVIPSLYM